ncbi:MAG: ABC transporter permease [Clostridia bacterium]|nr:ABC transporter permease [Clostridia bacterium]
MIWMLIFIIVPLVMVVYFAFTSSSGGFTFDNIIKVKEYTGQFLQSFKIGAISTVICLILGYPMAAIISRSREHVQRTLVMLCMIPMWMNFLLRTYSWMTLLENNGIINNILEYFHLPRLQMINTEGAIILGMVYNFLPFMIMPIYSVMAKIDYRLIEAAQDLGCNSFAVVRRVILPLSVPGVISGITMVFVPSASTFIISKLLGGGDMMIGDIIEAQIQGGANNLNLGAAISLVLMVVVLITMAIMNIFGDTESEVSLI